MLMERHAFLERVLDQPVDEENREALIQLVEAILEQDAVSLSRIADHKKKLLEHHLLLDRGVRAIKAYGRR